MLSQTRFAFCLALLLAGLSAGAPEAQRQTGGAAEDQATSRQVQRPGRSGLPLPRFVTLRAAKVNLRTGPGIRYPIDWVYQRPGMPLEVIDEFETWRRVRDWQGSVGWVHQSMLSGRRGAMVVGRLRLLRRRPEAAAPGLARVEPGVIARLLRCAERWCEVEVRGFEGWLEEREIYGVYPGESIQ